MHSMLMVVTIIIIGHLTICAVSVYIHLPGPSYHEVCKTKSHDDDNVHCYRYVTLSKPRP